MLDAVDAAPQIRCCTKFARQLADAENGVNVLLVGETGAGKSIVEIFTAIKMAHRRAVLKEKKIMPDSLRIRRFTSLPSTRAFSSQFIAMK